MMECLPSMSKMLGLISEPHTCMCVMVCMCVEIRGQLWGSRHGALTIRFGSKQPYLTILLTDHFFFFFFWDSVLPCFSGGLEISILLSRFLNAGKDKRLLGALARDQGFVRACSLVSVSRLSVGGAFQSGGAGSRGPLFLWLSDSHRECSFRDVQFTNRYLHQRPKEKVLLLCVCVCGGGIYEG